MRVVINTVLKMKMILMMMWWWWWCGGGGDGGDCGSISGDDDGDDVDDKLTRFSDFVNPVVFGISHYKKLQIIHV